MGMEMWLIKNLLWRAYQIVLFVLGVICFFKLDGEQIVGTGWPTVFSTWTVGFFTAYLGTKLTLWIIEKAQTTDLKHRQGRLRD